MALGYGVAQKTVNDHRSNHSDELLENKHWLRLEVQTKGGKQKVIHWTKKGIVRLGFFIKSENAKKFRDWAEDYITQPLHVNNTQDNNTPYIHQLQRENIELRRAINRLSLESHSDEFKELQYENKDLKRTLVRIHDNYHNIVMKSQEIEVVKKELWKMTNVFQMIKNIAKDGKNLNTETVAKHSYWN